MLDQWFIMSKLGHTLYEGDDTSTGQVRSDFTKKDAVHNPDISHANDADLDGRLKMEYSI
jgi:hypothetical protein